MRWPALLLAMPARKFTAIRSEPGSSCAARLIPKPEMMLDRRVLEARMGEVHKRLDHKLLNWIEPLGAPTLENLSRFIRLLHASQLMRVSVHRDRCSESCTYCGPQG